MSTNPNPASPDSGSIGLGKPWPIIYCPLSFFGGGEDSIPCWDQCGWYEGGKCILKRIHEDLKEISKWLKSS